MTSRLGSGASDDLAAGFDRRSSWLVLAVTEGRQHGGNEGYDDKPDSYYSWDSTVGNHARLMVGDNIILWNKATLLGVSAIEEIRLSTGTKELHKCPQCGRSGIKVRKSLRPRYHCYQCQAKFDEPVTEHVPVTTYRSDHQAGWIDLSGCLSAAQLRDLTIQRSSQLSIRQLRAAAFRIAVEHFCGARPLSLVELRARRIVGQFKPAIVRVRVGAPSLRARLFEAKGSACSFTGETPYAALEAGHLYSHGGVGERHDHGGLLLRRDLLRLLDLGYLSVHPASLRMDILPGLASNPQYRVLAGRSLADDNLPPGQRHWLASHWTQHRLHMRAAPNEAHERP